MTAIDPLLVEGTGRAAGRAYGEGVRALAREHHARVLDHLHRAVPRLDARRVEDSVRAHRAATLAALPEIAAEVDGLGEGAGLGTVAAWTLQMRAEVERAAGVAPVPECSAVAVLPGRGATGHVLAAQNVDLPPRYGPLLTAVRRRLDDGTTFLTVTPAGQLAHHGLNGHGVAVFATFVHTGGWRPGVPRYLLSRVALAARSCAAAVEAVTRVPRAAPRTLLVADPAEAACLELTPTEVAPVPAEGGCVLHTNHLLSDLRHLDTAGPAWRRNSGARLARLRTLLAGGPLGVADLQRVLRDRAGAPDALCHRAGDDPAVDYATVCSSVADTGARVLRVALGDPSTGAPAVDLPVEPSATTIRAAAAPGRSPSVPAR